MDVDELVNDCIIIFLFMISQIPFGHSEWLPFFFSIFSTEFKLSYLRKLLQPFDFHGSFLKFLKCDFSSITRTHILFVFCLVEAMPGWFNLIFHALHFSLDSFVPFILVYPQKSDDGAILGKMNCVFSSDSEGVRTSCGH